MEQEGRIQAEPGRLWEDGAGVQYELGSWSLQEEIRKRESGIGEDILRSAGDPFNSSAETLDTACGEMATVLVLQNSDQAWKTMCAHDS